VSTSSPVMRLDTTGRRQGRAQLSGGPGRGLVSSRPRWTPAVKLVRKL
jgi:hypothetical protein